jgi:hypothetical protein
MARHGLAAVKLSGEVEGSAVQELAEIATASDFTDLGDPFELSITNIRDNASLDVVSKSGLIVVREVIKAELIEKRMYKVTKATPLEHTKTANIIVRGSLSLPDRNLNDTDTEIAIRHNRGDNGGYYTMLASCILREFSGR